jgi:hypothetical protein
MSLCLVCTDRHTSRLVSDWFKSKTPRLVHSCQFRASMRLACVPIDTHATVFVSSGGPETVMRCFIHQMYVYGVTSK